MKSPRIGVSRGEGSVVALDAATSRKGEGARRRTFLGRLVGAATLNVEVYEEIEADRTATIQSLVIVLASSLAAGVGASGFAAGNPASAGVFSVIALVTWAAWAVMTYQIGVRVLPGPRTQADVGELLRTIGFATTPGLFRIFGLVPGVTTLVFAVTTVWMLLAMIVAVRQALDYTSTGRAVAVCGLGWTLAIVLAVVLGIFFGPSVS